jgi:hypothetical protein
MIVDEERWTKGGLSEVDVRTGSGECTAKVPTVAGGGGVLTDASWVTLTKLTGNSPSSPVRISVPCHQSLSGLDLRVMMSPALKESSPLSCAL